MKGDVLINDRLVVRGSGWRIIGGVLRGGLKRGMRILRGWLRRLGGGLS